MAATLFDEEFLRKLEYLNLVSRKLFRGRRRGEHQTYKKGSSLEFHDYRSYNPGDDFRYIDWNVYSRLDRLFVKIFTAEEDLSVHILIDTSASMAHGRPMKLDYAKKVGAALAYIAHSNLDRVGATAFSDKIGDTLPPQRGKNILQILEYFQSMEADGATRFSPSLTSYARSPRRPGLAIVISDLLDPAGYADGVLSLIYAGYEIIVIHIHFEQEIEPGLNGALRLIDCETGSEIRISADRHVLAMYRDRLDRYFADIEAFCLDRSVEYLRSSTIIPFEDLVLKYLRQGMYLH